MMDTSVLRVLVELAPSHMRFVSVLQNLVRQPLRVLVLKTSITQSKSMVMSKMILRVLRSSVLKNDSLQLLLFRVILLVLEKWDGMARLG